MSCQDVCLYQDAETRAVAEALGAVAVGPAATFWLYADGDGQWCVRRDREAEGRHFHKRDEALNFLRVSAARCSSHRLILSAPRSSSSRMDRHGRPHPSPARARQRPSRGWRRRLTGWMRAITWHAGTA
jgi:hypothetical protein